MKTIRNTKHMFGIVVVFVVMVTIFSAKADVPIGEYYVAISNASFLNIRQEPSIDSGIMTTRERGDIVTVTGQQKGLWVELSLDRLNEASEVRHGWVQITMLSLEQPTTQKGKITGKGNVLLRNSPNGKQITRLSPKTKVEVLARIEYDSTEWYRVRKGKYKGWIMSNYLEVETDED